MSSGHAHLLVGIDEREILSRIEREMTIAYGQLAVVVILVLLGVIPSWGYSNSWGYGPSGIVGTILVIVLILALLGRI